MKFMRRTTPPVVQTWQENYLNLLGIKNYFSSTKEFFKFNKNKLTAIKELKIDIVFIE